MEESIFILIKLEQQKKATLIFFACGKNKNIKKAILYIQYY